MAVAVTPIRSAVAVGRWQKLILAELKKRPAFYVKELLPKRFSRAEHVALLRAMCVLEDRGMIQVDRYVIGV